MNRRPLQKARTKLVREGPDYCEVEVEGQRFPYQPLFDEWWQPLLSHATEEVVKLREWLLCPEQASRHDWDITSDQPVYWVGHPLDNDVVRCVGPAAAMAALRRWFPFRDYQREIGEGGEEEEGQAGKVVEMRSSLPDRHPFSPPPASAAEIRQRLRAADDGWTPGRVG